VLVAFWSPKGGVGTTTLAAAAALVVSGAGQAVRFADLSGDAAAVLGVVGGEVGITDWLANGIDSPAAALDRISVDVAGRCRLIPRGRARLDPVAPEVGAALAVVLRDTPEVTVVDAGTGVDGAQRACIELADVSVVVVRACYLALARAAVDERVARASAVVVVEESGRALRTRDIESVLGRRVTATVPVRAAISRLIDAGILAARLPDALAQPLRSTMHAIGIGPDASYAA
jgi:MinD-like ATPase involved in chromosome partitioning or flagellar assembly